ncbi:MAG: diguanylate cyclase [Deltaproteobacteria bacterium]|nr:diguanylate cyclase [Deltaproteobacteria bacterium]
METHQNGEERHRIFKDLNIAFNLAFKQATHDALTGLPNRSLLHDRMGIALAEAKRRQEMLGVFFIDLDNFKETNDNFGHDAGDKVLVTISGRLSKVMRSEEIMARIGGDEFLALVRRIQFPDDAEIIATRFLKVLKRPILINNRSFVVTASIGISLYPFNGENEETLLKHADQAMYRVKKAGGNGLEFFKKPKKKSTKLICSKENKKDMSKQSILVVDDDPDFQLVLKCCLTKEGYSCIGVASIKEALEAVRLHTPDLVILDLGLQRASGFAFLQNFEKAILDGAKIPPVLVVSGYNDPEIIEFAKVIGASRFIAKPINAAQILSAVRSFIK